ncbi:MAG: mucoidy inhibitor MuiA family protein [Anaerolineales bacterium]|nr:mucoidy inhibitor MuiA family protein [Anaerolineales bacterium]
MSKPESSIHQVIVYPDRARLTRRSEIALEAGAHQIEIADLPVVINPDSLRATAHGTARARLLGLQAHKVFYSDTPSEQAHELEMQIETLQDEIAALDTQSELLKQQHLKLDALAGHTQIYATALAAGETSLEAQLAFYDSLRATMSQLDTEQHQLAIRRREMDRRLAQLKRQLDLLRSARPRERYAAFVEVEVTDPGSLTVELTYVVSNAGWKPLYDLRLVEENGKAELEIGYLAQVTQQTGENWENVELTLSTARPALAATLPELEPWFIGPPPPVMRAALPKAAAPTGMVMAAAAPDMAMREVSKIAEAEAEVVQASVDSSGAAVTYHVPAKVSIPADGAPHKVSVARYSLPPKLDYVSAPKLAEAAYRRAKVTNDSLYTLLPGAANLFAGGEFIGTTRLDLTAPQGMIELYLGADDRLKVQRELKRREVDKTLIGGKRRIHFGYEIRLENLLPGEAHITIHDQLPVSRHEEIKVRLDSADPKPAQQSELNQLDWELTLFAREKRTIRFDFTVEYPQDMSIAGLP